MINTLVTDLIRQSKHNIAESAVCRWKIMCVNSPALIAYSDEINLGQRALKNFLRINLYRHYRVLRMSAKAQRIITTCLTSS